MAYQTRNCRKKNVTLSSCHSFKGQFDINNLSLLQHITIVVYYGKLSHEGMSIASGRIIYGNQIRGDN